MVVVVLRPGLVGVVGTSVVVVEEEEELVENWRPFEPSVVVVELVVVEVGRG